MLSKYQINRKVGIKIKMISIREVTVKYNNLGVPDTVYKGVIRQTDSYVTRLVIDLTDIPGDIINVGLNAKKDDGSTNKDGLIICHPIVGQVKKYYVDINNWYTNIPGTLELTVQALSSMNGLTQVFNCSKINFAIEGTAIELDETVTPESYTVLSINNQTGVVELDAEDVGALPDDTPIPARLSDLDNDEGFIKESELETMLLDYVLKEEGKSLFSGSYNDLTDRPDIPTKTSDLTNDSGFITEEDLPPQYDDTDLKSRLSAIEEIIESIDGETDADNVINKLHEIVALLDGYAEGTTLVNLLSGKADTNHNHDSVYVKQVEGKTLTDNNLTNTLKSYYDTAYSHSQTAHAPSNAQANIIETVKVNGVALPVNNKAVDILTKPQQSNSIPSTLISGQTYYETLSANKTISSMVEGASGYLNQWHFIATMGTTAYTITFTPTIKWATALPTFEANKTYEFSIMKVGSVYLGVWTEYA